MENTKENDNIKERTKINEESIPVQFERNDTTEENQSTEY